MGNLSFVGRVTLAIAGTGEVVSFRPSDAHRAAALRMLKEPIERCTGWITWGDLRAILTGDNSHGLGNLAGREQCLAIIAGLRSDRVSSRD